MVARYFGMISQLDDAFGKILRALHETGHADNTLIVFTSPRRHVRKPIKCWTSTMCFSRTTRAYHCV
jgi:membrane-anchored protein YejM (alkaline phosphatase superfamily)